MNIVSYGGGINSTAMLIYMVNNKIPVELILFADTGGEKPHTYEYIKYFSYWLVKNNYPEIIIVRKKGNGETLEEECLRRNCLPSIAYGFKSCSQKFKIQPQDMYCNNYEDFKKEWANSRKITKFIGFDADEPHRAKDFTDSKYIVEYPLIEHNLGRDDCIELIKKQGLSVPKKSSCFFCPSSKVSEIKELKYTYPDLLDRSIKIERNAELTSVVGLGRNYTWENVTSTDELFDELYVIESPCGCYDG